MRKIKLIGTEKTVMSNPMSIHNYFAWPSMVKLQNGKIAIAASGFRLHHLCPFGKAVMAFSEDNGETYTSPMVVIDTPLDDRDAGLCTFGESGLILTSFNNRVEVQRKWSEEYSKTEAIKTYRNGYLDNITKEDEEKYLGATYRISYDCGTTFGPLYKSPITSPHGPIELKDGSVLWVGTVANRKEGDTLPRVRAYKINLDGSMDYLGCIADVPGRIAHEPYTVELDDGTLLTLIRIGQPEFAPCGMTAFQSISKDGGKTWSEPQNVLGDNEGSPPHILKHSSGILVLTTGHRSDPLEVRIAFSNDNGKTWDTGYSLNKACVTDIGYPMSVELDDGSILTVYYTHKNPTSPAEIVQQRWSFE